jgi:mycothiol synthase
MDLPEGYTTRPATLDDVRPCFELGIAVDIEEYGEPDWDESDLRDDWARERFDLARDTWLAHAPDGTLHGFGLAWDKSPHTFVVGDVFAHPEGPDLYPWLVHRIVTRAAEHAAEGEGSATVHVYNSEPNARRAAALRAAGFEVCRVFRRMVIDFAGPVPEPAPAPGVTIRRATEADHPVVWELLTQSFAEHFDHVAEPYAAWHARMVGSDSYRPDCWWLADVDGVPAGVLVGQRHDENGWVKSLGTLPSARGRGVGTTLLLTAFRAWQEQGVPRVGLGVDSDNSTGAMGLYERIGMRAEQRYDCYELVVTSS